MSSTLFIVDDAPFGNARGLCDEELVEVAKRGTVSQLADWTALADKVLVF